MKKRVLSILLSLVMLCGLITPAAAAEEGGYKDTQGHWAEEAINRWSGYGIVGGYGGNLFGPKDNITRAQMAAILSRTLGLTDEAEKNPFVDVPADAWYTAYILRCNEAGIMLGDADKKANPQAHITRQAAMTMICRAFAVAASESADISAFTDGKDTSAYAAPYLATLVELGVVGGIGNGLLAPTGNMTRAAMVAVIDRLVIQYINEPGQYTLTDGEGLIVIASGDVTLTGKTCANILVAPGADGKKVTFDKATVTGSITVQADDATIIKKNSKLPAATMTGKGSKVQNYAGGSSSGGGGSAPSVPSGPSDLTITESKTVNAGTYKNVTIADSVGDGEVTLNGLTIEGDLLVKGGGSNTIKLIDCVIKGKIIMAKVGGEAPRLYLTETPVAAIEVQKAAIIEATDAESAVTSVVAKADLEVKGEQTAIDTITVPAEAEDAVAITVTAGAVETVEAKSETTVTGAADSIAEVVAEAPVDVDSAAVAKVEIPATAPADVAVEISGDASIEVAVNTTNGVDITTNSSNVEFSTELETTPDFTVNGTETHIHKWDEGEVTTEPTCENPGEKTYTCTAGCNETKTEPVDATGHAYGDWIKLDNDQHQKVCANDANHVLKEDHKWDEGKVTTDSACDEPGVKTYTCTVETCGATKTEAVDAVGHDWDEGEITTPATCEGEGEKTYTCKNDANHTKTEPVAATGHAYGDWIKCDDNQHQKVCANDANHVLKEDHTWDAGKITTDPTFTAEGVKTYTCTVETCGETKTESVAKKQVVILYRNRAAANYTVSTDGENSWYEFAAVVDGVEKSAIRVDAASLNGGTFASLIDKTMPLFVAYTKETRGGNDYYTISASDRKAATISFQYQNSSTDKIGYTYTDGTLTLGAGSSLKTYTLDANVTIARAVDDSNVALGRVVTWTPAQLEAHGRDTNDYAWVYDLDSDGDVDYLLIQKKGDDACTGGAAHNWGEGVVTTQPTCETAGVKTYACTAGCGATMTEAVAALGHDWDEGEVTTEPTCEDEGEKTYTCKNDATHTKTEAVAATGHAYGDWIRLDDDQHQKVCANDASHVQTADHTWDEGKVTTEPTETTDGVKTYTCTETTCGATKTETVPATPTEPDPTSVYWTSAGKLAWTAVADAAKYRVSVYEGNTAEGSAVLTRTPTVTSYNMQNIVMTLAEEAAVTYSVKVEALDDNNNVLSEVGTLNAAIVVTVAGTAPDYSFVVADDGLTYTMTFAEGTPNGPRTMFWKSVGGESEYNILNEYNTLTSTYTRTSAFADGDTVSLRIFSSSEINTEETVWAVTLTPTSTKTYTAEPETPADQKNGYDITWSVANHGIRAKITAPESADAQACYTIYLYDSNSNTHYSYSNVKTSMNPDLALSAGTYDRVRLYPYVSGTSVNDQEPLADWALEKKIVVDEGEFGFPSANVSAERSGNDLVISGFNFDSYACKLAVGSSATTIFDATLTNAAWLIGDGSTDTTLVLTARTASEESDKFTLSYSGTLTVVLPAVGNQTVEMPKGISSVRVAGMSIVLGMEAPDDMTNIDYLKLGFYDSTAKEASLMTGITYHAESASFYVSREKFNSAYNYDKVEITAVAKNGYENAVLTADISVTQTGKQLTGSYTYDPDNQPAPLVIVNFADAVPGFYQAGVMSGDVLVGEYHYGDAAEDGLSFSFGGLTQEEIDAITAETAMVTLAGWNVTQAELVEGILTIAFTSYAETEIETDSAPDTHTCVWDEGEVTTEPTCEGEGEKTYTCKNDATHTKTEPVAATGHDWDEGEVTTEPTCEDEGEKTYTCKNDATHTKTEAVAATGHAYGDWIKCDDDQHQKVCANDASHVQTADHIWDNGQITTDPTFTTEGVKTYTCTETTCGETKTESVAKKQVVILYRNRAAANYTVSTDGENSWYEFAAVIDGEAKGVIRVDAASLNGGTFASLIDKTMPLFVAYTKETRGGNDYYTISTSDRKAATISFQYQNSSTDKIGYTYTDGTLTLGAGTSLKTFPLDANVTIARAVDDGSTEGAVVVWTVAQLTAHGRDTNDYAWVYDLDGDGDVDYLLIQKKGDDACIGGAAHNWGEGVVTTQPTCETAGVKTYTCTAGCGATMTEAIDALGHDWDEGEVTTEPTCEDEGEKTYTCKNDATHTKTEAIDPTGHDWDEGEVTTEPTYGTAGEKTYTCQNNAEHTRTEAVAKRQEVILYRNRAAANYTASTEGEDSWFEFAAVVDGEAKGVIRVDAESLNGDTFASLIDRTMVVFTAYTVETRGGYDYYTLSTADRKTPSAYYQSSTKCGFTFSHNLLTLGVTNGSNSGNYVLDSNVTIARAIDDGSTEGQMIVWTVSALETLAKDTNDYAWPYDTDGDGYVDYLLIQKKGTDPCPDDAHSYEAKVTTAATYTAEGVKTYTCSACGATKTESIAKVKAVALFVPPHASGASASIKANPNTTEYNGETYYQYPAMVDGEAKMIWVAETSIWSDKTADTLGVTGSWIMWFGDYAADGEYYTISSQLSDNAFAYSGFGASSAGYKYNAETQQIQLGQDSYASKKTFDLDDAAMIVRFGGGTGSKATAYTVETLPEDTNNPDYVRAYNFGGDDTIDVIVLYGR